MRVIEYRPFNTAGMSSKLWMEIEPTTVLLENLILTQRQLYIGAMIRLGRGEKNLHTTKPGWTPPDTDSGDPLPHVVKWKGEFYVEDGHHRVMTAYIQGDVTIVARVLDLDVRQPNRTLREEQFA